MRRNLIFYCYPFRGGRWRRSIAHLLTHWDQFDGRKIVTISTDRCTDEAWEVVQAFGHDANLEIEWIEARNNRPLQETAHFLPMVEKIIDEPGITLYAHAKSAVNDCPASWLWLNAMAEACLDYPQLVDCCFESGANIAGAFRSHGLWSFSGYHNWHFAGTWFWFRNERIRELDWRNVHQSFEGVEAWPGIVPLAESACLLFDGANTGHLYSVDFWKTTLTPAIRCWRRSLAAAGLRPIAEAVPA